MSNYQPNDLFHNRYQLLRVVGEGGMSKVWAAKDTLTDTTVAVKIFSYSGQLDERARDSFKNEFKLMFNLNHPNLFHPTHFDIELKHKAPYLVSKLYTHGSAEGLINKTDEHLPERDIALFLRDAATALRILHTQSEPIIHQDIKPDNFLIDDDGSYILADFGVSIRKRETRLMSDRDNNTAGDTPYVAPERFLNAFPKPSQDIFSLGVTLYEILSGVLPFQKFGGKLLNMGHDVPDLDAGFIYSTRLNLICKRCMDLEPDARPTANQLLEWATYYLKENHWPNIPQVDVAGIKANRIFELAQKLYSRIITTPLNELDIAEVRKCINDFNTVLGLQPEFQGCSILIVKTKTILSELLNFDQLEKRSLDLIKDEKSSIDVIHELLNDYNKIASRLSPIFLQQKTLGLKTFFETKTKNEEEKELKKLNALLSCDFINLKIDDAKTLLESHQKAWSKWPDKLAELKLLIAKAQSYSALKAKYDDLLNTPIEKLDNDKISAIITGFVNLNDSGLRLMILRLQEKIEDKKNYDSLKNKVAGITGLKLSGLGFTELEKYQKQVSVIMLDYRVLHNKYHNNSSLISIKNKLEKITLEINGFLKIQNENKSLPGEKTIEQPSELAEDVLKVEGGKVIELTKTTSTPISVAQDINTASIGNIVINLIPEKELIEEKRKRKKRAIWFFSILAGIVLTIGVIGHFNMPMVDKPETVIQTESLESSPPVNPPPSNTSTVNLVPKTNEPGSITKEEENVNSALGNNTPTSETSNVPKSEPNEGLTAIKAKDETVLPPVIQTPKSDGSNLTEVENTKNEREATTISKPEIPKVNPITSIVDKTNTPPKITMPQKVADVVLPNNKTTISALAIDTDGSINNYRWEQISGSECVLSGENTPYLQLSSLNEGTYMFKVTVTDNRGASSNTATQLIVRKKKPRL